MHIAIYLVGQESPAGNYKTTHQWSVQVSNILSRETIKIMMKVQRLVKDEFGVRVGLDDDNASAMLLAYASRSQSEELIRLSAELASSLIPGETQASASELATDSSRVKQRVYRGRVIVEEVEDQPGDQDADGKSNMKKGVIYRGNAVAA
jgi:hypothetical protein